MSREEVEEAFVLGMWWMNMEDLCQFDGEFQCARIHSERETLKVHIIEIFK